MRIVLATNSNKRQFRRGDGVFTFSAWVLFSMAAMAGFLISENVEAQSIRFPWNGYGHDAQHDAIASAPSQPLNRICGRRRWT